MAKTENSKTLALIESRFLKAEKARDDHVKRWQVYYDLYRSRPKPQDEATRSNLFIPEIYTTIETITPRLIANFLNANKPLVTFLPRKPEDIENADSADMLLHYQFERMNLPVKLVTFYKQALLTGTSVAKIYWRYETKIEENGDTKIVYDGPAFDVLNLKEFYIDPNATSLEDAKYCIHKTTVTKEHLETMEKKGIYKNIEKLQEKNEDKERDIGGVKSDNVYDENNEEDIELWEYWEDDRVVTIADRRIILRDIKNPFAHGKKPFIYIVFVPVPFEFYGIGAVEPLEYLQSALNTIWNQRMDNVNLVINRMWLLQRGAMDDVNQLVSAPGNIIEVNDINGLQPLPTPDVTGSSYKEEDKIRFNMANTSGVSDYVKGNDDYGKQVTAFEVRVKAEQSNGRFDVNFRLMAEMGLKKTAKMCHQLNQQFINEETIVRVVGKNGVEFKKLQPWQIQGEYDVECNIDPMEITKQENRQQALELRNQFRGDPTVNPIAMNRKVLEAYDWDPDEFLQEPPPPMPQPEQAPPQNPEMPQPGMMPPQQQQKPDPREMLQSLPPELLQALPPELVQGVANGEFPPEALMQAVEEMLGGQQ